MRAFRKMFCVNAVSFFVGISGFWVDLCASEGSPLGDQNLDHGMSSSVNSWEISN